MLLGFSLQQAHPFWKAPSPRVAGKGILGAISSLKEHLGKTQKRQRLPRAAVGSPSACLLELWGCSTEGTVEMGWGWTWNSEVFSIMIL